MTHNWSGFPGAFCLNCGATLEMNYEGELVIDPPSLEECPKTEHNLRSPESSRED